MGDRTDGSGQRERARTGEEGPHPRSRRDARFRDIGSGVPHPDLDVLVELEAELPEHGAGFAHHPSPVGGALAPSRWRPRKRQGCRYLVVPERPAGTEGCGEDELAGLVMRNALIGTELARSPGNPVGPRTGSEHR